MPEYWQQPVTHPLFTDALAQELVETAKVKGRYEVDLNIVSETAKDKAFATRMRFSDSGRCARQIAYDDLGVVPSVWDVTSLHVAFVGTVYHVLLQGAIERRMPGVLVEVKGHVPEANNSGHCDAVATEKVLLDWAADWAGGDVLYELKTKSSYQFDTAVGVMRKAWKRQDPKGPGLEVIIQAGMNAKAHGCETVVIGYVCFENFSIGLAEKTGLRQMDRFMAEWHIPKNVWEPLVAQEIDRLNEVMRLVDQGYLPEREVYGDDRELHIINPEATKPAWNCQYCSHRIQCEDDGPGVVEIPVTIRPAVSA